MNNYVRDLKKGKDEPGCKENDLMVELKRFYGIQDNVDEQNVGE